MSSPIPSFIETSLQECIRITGRLFDDNRGCFHKVYSEDVTDGLPEKIEIRELFWSESNRGVVRGMHFQLPPKSVRKLVWVSSGVISDVILDLRLGSPTYGDSISFELDRSAGAVYIPVGCAHGFEVLSESAIVNYAQDGGFDPLLDSGIHWASFGHQWVSREPVVSHRDSQLTKLDAFQTPFVWREN